jgi:hypothetical protein
VSGRVHSSGARQRAVKSVPVSVRKQFSEDASDFLNSFIADDLARVARAVGQDDYGAGLDTYLRGGERPDRRQRVDVPHTLGQVYERIASSRRGSCGRARRTPRSESGTRQK